MPLITYLLEFPISQNFHTRENHLKILEQIILCALEKFREFRGNLKISYEATNYIIFEGPRNSLITVKYYQNNPKSSVSINIEYFWDVGKGEKSLLTYQDCKNLELGWEEKANEIFEAALKKQVKTVPGILRSIPFDIYFPTSDERVLEYDIDHLLYDSHSPFQHIQILHSKSHGNMLVLDDDPNLAESDAIYTNFLLRMDQGEKYEEKEILVLGGGDGAVLNTLLSQNPKKVTMIEIDQLVVDACRKHMRTLCGDSLDNLSGAKKEIIIGDCLPHMERMKEQGLFFDSIVGDLTTIPISGGHSECEVSTFLRKVLNLVFQILKPNGKYLTHAPGISGTKSAQMLEKLILEINPKLEFNKISAFVPSFHENWTFYQFTRS